MTLRPYFTNLHLGAGSVAVRVCLFFETSPCWFLYQQPALWMPSPHASHTSHTQAVASEIQGCIHITLHRKVEPDVGPAGFLNPDIPEVLLVEHLKASGWFFGQRLTPHTKDGPGNDKLSPWTGAWFHLMTCGVAV